MINNNKSQPNNSRKLEVDDSMNTIQATSELEK